MLLSCHLGVNNNNPFFGIFFILIFSLLVPDYRNYVILVIQFLIVQIGSPKYSNYYNQYFCHYVVQFFTQCQINDTLVIKKKNQEYLNLVTKWWIIIRISSLASSLPGQACTPLPNGMKVLGFGGTCMINEQINNYFPVLRMN